MVSDLTAMDLANASLLDEATAAAEAMTMLRRVNTKGGDTFFVDAGCHPQTIDVVRTRAEPLGIDVVVGEPGSLRDGTDRTEGVFGVLLQYPGTTGEIRDDRELVAHLHAQGTLVAVAADLLALVLLTPPGEWGADVVVGSAQRFGVPMAYGGPHAAFFATREEYKRNLPGRLRRRLGRLRGPARAAPRVADARAAHPPREGHQQHLHRAGAAGEHRRHVRGVPRPRRPPRHRRSACTRSPPSSPPGCACRRAVHETFFDTIAVRVPDASTTSSRRGHDAGSTCDASTTPRSAIVARRDHHP